MKQNRGKLDDTLAAMFSNPTYRENYLFYAHMIGMCSIKIRNDIPAPAGVRFNQDHYEMFINPDSKWVDAKDVKKWFKPSVISTLTDDDFKTIDGADKVRIRKGFDDFSLVERLSILKHEMLHILYGHVTHRKADIPKKKFRKWNYATDCALNQHIDPNHLPKSAVLPKGFEMMFDVKAPNNKSSEFYFELIKDKERDGGDGGDGGDGDGDGDGEGSGNMDGNDDMDSHDTWEESEGDKDLQKDMTKKMIERSQNETIKSKGKVPGECNDWMKLHTRKAEVNWKKVLRGIVGNKRVGSRPTIMRSDRRFPKRDDLRGKTKDRMFNLLVVADVSGSMSDKAVLDTLAEVRHICDVTKTDVDLIQIDSCAYTPEKLSKNTKLIGRKGRGGTELHPALRMAAKHKIDYQAVVVLTDGGLWGGDVDHFKALKKKVIWLIEEDGQVLDEMTSGKMQAFKLKGSKQK